jgi:hypothetical protein
MHFCDRIMICLYMVVHYATPEFNTKISRPRRTGLVHVLDVQLVLTSCNVSMQLSSWRLRIAASSVLNYVTTGK